MSNQPRVIFGHCHLLTIIVTVFGKATFEHRQDVILQSCMSIFLVGHFLLSCIRCQQIPRQHIRYFPFLPDEKPAHLTNLRASYTRDDLLAEHESFAPIPSCLQWFWQRRESDPPLHHAEPSSIPRCSTRDSHLDRQTSSHHRLLLHRKNRFHKNRNWENVSKTSIIAHSCASLSLSPRQRT